MYCTKCGNEVRPEDKFCVRCGNAINKDNTSRSIISESSLSTNKNKNIAIKKNSKKRAGIIAGSVVGCIVVFAVIAFFLLNYFGLSVMNLIGFGDDVWRYDKKIKKPITAISSEEDITLGEIDADGVSVYIPSDTFDNQTNVTLSHPEKKLEIDQTSFEPLSAPISINSTGEQKRLNKPIKVTLSFDTLERDKSGVLYIAALNEKNKWDYIEPDVFDLKKKLITFTTCRLGTYGFVNLKKERFIDEFSGNKAVKQWTISSLEDEAGCSRDEIIKDILQNKLAILDKTSLDKVLDAVRSECPSKKLAIALVDKDSKEFIQILTESVGRNIPKLVDPMILKESLEGITKQQWADNVSDKLSEKLKEGNLTQATILVIEDIADEFIEEQVENIWIDLADRKIRIWENSEIEGAYQVFKNGVDSESLWGYKVIAGDFDNLWTQMKGIAEEIVNMDLSSYCRINNKKIDELSEEELTKIKEDVKQRTKAQFEERLQQDEEVEKIKIENKKMIEILNQKGLLNLELTNPAFNAEDDLMTLINRIYVKIENVKKDTGRFDVAFPANEVGKTDELKKEAMINAEDLADLIYIWFGEGDDSYKQAISDRKLIIEQPEIQDEDVIIEVVNMSLDDYWQRDDGLLIEIQGSEGYFRSFSSSWQIMAEQGIVALGDAKMKNIVQLGENIWSCDDLWYADKEEGSEIYWSDEAEITMSNDGKSIVIITKATNPLSGEKKEGSRTFYRYVEGQDLQIQDEKTEQKESQEPAEIGLDGYWKGKYDFIIKIDGDKSTFIQFSSGQQKYADLGMVSLGDLQMKEIEKIGENKWSCYILYFFSLDDKPYSVGWSEKSTITMSANGKTITLNSTGKHPKTGKVFTNESEYSRTIPPIAQ